jgi:hypothetical protein
VKIESNNNDNKAEAQSKRRELTNALTERGMVGALHIVDELDDDEVAAASHAVAAYDTVRGEKTPGLLVHLLRTGVPAPEAAPAAVHSPPSPRLIASVRASCRTPNGLERDEARSLYANAARRHGLSADELINLAMGPSWQRTPVHPALDPENPNKARDYEVWVAGE